MNPNAPTLDLMTLDEVAAALGVHRTTVEEWCYKKELASFKKGKTRRVLREDLIRFVGLNTLKPRRPDWLTAAVESEFLKLLRQLIAGEVSQQLKERIAA